MLIGAQTTALALQTEDYTFSDHSLIKCFSNIIFCPGKLICWSSDCSYSVFRLCVSTYLVVVVTHNITLRASKHVIFHEKYSDSCPSTEYRSIFRRRNIDDGISMVILCVSIPQGRSKHIVERRNMNHHCSNILVYQGKILCLRIISSSYDRWMYNLLFEALTP